MYVLVVYSGRMVLLDSSAEAMPEAGSVPTPFSHCIDCQKKIRGANRGDILGIAFPSQFQRER